MKYKRIYIQLFSIMCMAAVWELTAIHINLPAVFPRLEELCRQTLKLFSTSHFYIETGTTVLRGFFGLTLASASGFLLGTLAAFSPFCNSFCRPIVVLLRSIPVISFILLAMLWFSPNYLPVFIAWITLFPIIYQNTATAIHNTDRRWVEMAATFGYKPFGRFMQVYLPAAKNALFDGWTTASGFGWRAVIMGEALAQPLHGIGSSMKTAQAFIQVPQLMAWTLVAIAISYLFDVLLHQARKIRFTYKLPSAQPFSLPTPQSDLPLKKLSVIKLEKQFGQHSILHNYSAQFDNTAITCIKGTSGQGKTTLLRLLAGLDLQYNGEIRIPNGYTLSYAFQEDRLLPWLNVRENIVFVLKPHCKNRQYMADITTYLLAETGLSEHADKYPSQLSGGQRQRVNLARALCVQADILLLDEPLTGLDDDTKQQVLNLILEWTGSRRPIVIWATHENIRTARNVNMETLK